MYNVEKGTLKSKRKQNDDETAGPSKKSKIHTMYPALDEPDSDEVTYNRHVKAMDQEMSKEKPRKEVLADLLKQTFLHRRNFVLNEAESASEVLEKFPGLKISDMVSMYLVY